MSLKVPFLSLAPGQDSARITAAVARVLASGWFILGAELEAFEREFAAASGAPHAVGVGNGTDALALVLKALGIGPGDEVITSPLSAAFSALAIVMSGATPVFADIDPVRLTLDPDAAAAAITPRTAAIMPVHLYGQAADMPRFVALAERHGLALIEDACQAHLATCGGQPVGTFGAAAGFSFYPTKNLGAVGDAGAVITRDAALADKVRRLGNGGQAERYRHIELGVNSRLDEIQAAVLRERLQDLPAATARRRAIARRYREALSEGTVTVPTECDPGHVYHLFPVLTDEREAFMPFLASQGIGSLVHYPFTIPSQPAFECFVVPCPVAERVARRVCSLPLYPHLTDEACERVTAAVHAWRMASSA